MKKQDVNLVLDTGMMSCIFFMTITEVSSFWFSYKYDTIKYNELNPYVFYYAPLLSSITTLITASFFLFKIMRFKSCFLTKLITTSFFINQAITCAIIYNGYNSELYMNTIYPIYLLSLTILFVKWIIKTIKK